MRNTADELKRAGSEQIEEVKDFGREQLEAASTAATSVAKKLQLIAAETTGFSLQTLKRNTTYLDRLLGAGSLQNAIQVQTDYAKNTYEEIVSQARRMGELYVDIARSSLLPAENAFSKAKEASTNRI
jgi:hypothetical protein